MPRYDYDLAFVDFETRSPVDLPTHGLDRYAADPDTDALCLGWFMDDDPVGGLWSPEFYWKGENSSLIDLHNHVYHGGLVVAWNARFDRKIWNEVMVPEYDWPPVPINQWLCAQAQAEANNLPAKLEKAAECLRVQNKKDARGKSLIAALSIGTRATWDQTLRPQDLMRGMRNYCLDDNRAMRDIWRSTRPLTLEEWAQYHASERINDRGVAVDYEFAAAAQAYAGAELADVNEWLAEITGEDITTTQHIRKAQWLHQQLAPSPELQQVCEKPVRGKDEDGNPKPPKISADRPRRETVAELITAYPHCDILGAETVQRVTDFLEAVDAGNSAAVYKFRAIANTHVNGRVFGQYSFNGAGQTGRFSSRGVQIHNLIRAALDKNNPDAALDAIDAIMSQTHPDDLVDMFGMSVSRILARLLRPTFIAPEGGVLVWIDWDQVEARILPWLANSPGGDAMLAVFESGRDVYIIAAAGIYGKSEGEISDDERQIGKIAVLSLGFGGGVNAFLQMARNYGVVLDRARAEEIVARWRDSNRWAGQFWSDVRQAVYAAYRTPLTWYTAGRLKYLYHPDLMHGTLICTLPCGRWIVYPQFKEIEYLELDDGSVVNSTDPDFDRLLAEGAGERRESLSFVKGFSGGFARVRAWHGTFVENATQGYAGSLLREVLTDADKDELLEVVLHTHDEIVAECDIEDEQQVRDRLTELMVKDRGHNAGLPLSATAESGPYYTK